jgi:formylglycine-generating enzyme required for sulfatase activity
MICKTVKKTFLTNLLLISFMIWLSSCNDDPETISDISTHNNVTTTPYLSELNSGSTPSPSIQPPTPTVLEATSNSTPSIPTPNLTTTSKALVSPSKMMLVPEGIFSMGCDSGQKRKKCEPDELPLHKVFINEYSIDQTEVTIAQYNQCVQSSACQFPQVSSSKTRLDYFINPEYANFPVVGVTWQDAADYCTWAGKRLPTEAEWEKAARGDQDLRMFPWGNQMPSCDLFNIDIISGSCRGDTTAVGAYPDSASPYGVLDMLGNVEEWVADWYSKSYYYQSPYQNPIGTDRLA